MSTYEKSLHNRIKRIDLLMDKLSKERQKLFIETIRLNSRNNDKQTDLCDYIKEREINAKS